MQNHLTTMTRSYCLHSSAGVHIVLGSCLGQRNKLESKAFLQFKYAIIQTEILRKAALALARGVHVHVLQKCVISLKTM